MKKDRQNKLARQQAFLDAYIKYGHLGAAATSANCSVASHYNWMKGKQYKKRFEEASQKFQGSLVKEAITRARDGVETVLTHKGQVQYEVDPVTGETKLDDNFMPIPATVLKVSDRLLALALKAQVQTFKPDSDKVNVEISGPEKGPIESIIQVEFVDTEKKDGTSIDK